MDTFWHWSTSLIYSHRVILLQEIKIGEILIIQPFTWLILSIKKVKKKIIIICNFYNISN